MLQMLMNVFGSQIVLAQDGAATAASVARVHFLTFTEP
jgi:hypothetical protein